MINYITNFLQPSAVQEDTEKENIPTDTTKKANDIACKTLYTLGLIFSAIAIYLFLSPQIMLEALGISLGMAFLTLKAAHELYVNGEMSIPKIAVNFGPLQIGQR